MMPLQEMINYIYNQGQPIESKEAITEECILAWAPAFSVKKFHVARYTPGDIDKQLSRIIHDPSAMQFYVLCGGEYYLDQDRVKVSLKNTDLPIVPSIAGRINRLKFKCMLDPNSEIAREYCRIEEEFFRKKIIENIHDLLYNYMTKDASETDNIILPERLEGRIVYPDESRKSNNAFELYFDRLSEVVDRFKTRAKENYRTIEEEAKTLIYCCNEIKWNSETVAVLDDNTLLLKYPRPAPQNLVNHYHNSCSDLLKLVAEAYPIQEFT